MKRLPWRVTFLSLNPVVVSLWKMGVGDYPQPVFYWQTTAPKADIEQLTIEK